MQRAIIAVVAAEVNTPFLSITLCETEIPYSSVHEGRCTFDVPLVICSHGKRADKNGGHNEVGKNRWNPYGAYLNSKYTDYMKTTGVDFDSTSTLSGYTKVPG